MTDNTAASFLSNTAFEREAETLKYNNSKQKHNNNSKQKYNNSKLKHNNS